MASYTINKSYACNYDSAYNYHDIGIAKNDYKEEQTVILQAALSGAQLAAKVQEYVDAVSVGFATS